MLIKKISDINFSAGDNITFLATVLEVTNDGDGDKRPIKAVLKLEESGESVNICSWRFEYLPELKRLVNTVDVMEFNGVANLYKETEQQLRIGTIKDAHMQSSKKVIKTLSGEEYKNEVISIINTYIPKTHKYYELLNKLVIQNEKFWKWPAATRVHHAYPGGLAKHSLNVCKNAISIWKTYNGENLNIALLVAGSLLHDVGKVQEYNADGTRTIYGDLIPHPVAGYEKVIRACLELGIDPEKDTDAIMLGHVILSHHEKLEFGAPCTPGIYEALIVARSDALDATAEAIDHSLQNQQINTSSDFLISLGGKAFKWHN